MTDTPDIIHAVPIHVGQRWKTRYGQTVRILAIDGMGNFPVIGQVDNGALGRWKASGASGNEGFDGGDLVSLVPQTIKLEMALCRERDGDLFAREIQYINPTWLRVSDVVTVEFTLLTEESVCGLAGRPA